MKSVLLGFRDFALEMIEHSWMRFIWILDSGIGLMDKQTKIIILQEVEINIFKRLRLNFME